MQFLRSGLNRGERPLYIGIADAIHRAIEEGALHPGERLPPQRQLAAELGIDLTTVTRGYAEARRRGLIDAGVGRGTFVRDDHRRGDTRREDDEPDTDTARLVDLTMNLPPQPDHPSLRDMLHEGFERLLRRADMASLMTYHLGSGLPADHAAGAAWLRPVLGEIDPARALVCSGAQCAITALLTLLARPGDTVLTEPLTYPRFRAAAAHLGIGLTAVEADDDGMVPDALDAACRTLSPRAVYTTPTMHNPTAITMSPARRAAIADVVRRHQVAIIEDDAYGRLPSEPVAAIATLAPELTWYLGTLSKCLSPGLRIAYVVAPGRAEGDQLETAIRATSLTPPPLMTALVSGWIRQGAADALCAGIRDELVARQRIAREVLPDGSFHAHPEGPHVWLTLPPRWHRIAFTVRARGLGLALTPSDPFAVGQTPPNAVRIGLGAARGRVELRTALESVAAMLRDEVPDDFGDIV